MKQNFAMLIVIVGFIILGNGMSQRGNETLGPVVQALETPVLTEHNQKPPKRDFNFGIVAGMLVTIAGTALYFSGDRRHG